MEARLVKNDGHWQDVEPAVNLDYLQERLSAASATQGPESNAADLSAASSDGQARLVQLMTDIQQWQADGGSNNEFIEQVLRSGCVKACKWVLGISRTVVGLPSGMVRERDAEIPRRWDEFFMDALATDEHNSKDVSLTDMKVGAFSATSITSLKLGNLGGIDFDKDFVCPILRHTAGEHLRRIPVAESTIQPMTLVDVMRDPVRLMAHMMYVPRLLHCIGLPMDADRADAPSQASRPTHGATQRGRPVRRRLATLRPPVTMPRCSLTPGASPRGRSASESAPARGPSAPSVSSSTRLCYSCEGC